MKPQSFRNRRLPLRESRPPSGVFMTPFETLTSAPDSESPFTSNDSQLPSLTELFVSSHGTGLLFRDAETQQPSRAGFLITPYEDLISPPDAVSLSTSTEIQQPSHTSPQGILFGPQSSIRDLVKNPYYIVRAATKVCAGIAKAWKLDDSDAENLLDVDSETWMRIKNKKWSGLLDQEQLMRINAIIGLYKALHSCFNGDLADRWVKQPNTEWIFSGRKPVDVMVEGGLPVIVKTRRYLIDG